MTTSDEVYAPPLTDWDDPPNSTYEMWTTVNAAEVVPGVWHPLLSGWFQERQRICFGEMFDRLGIADEITILPDPIPNFIGSWAGRLALNVSFTTAIVTSYQTGEGSSAVEQLFTADEEGGHVAEASTDLDRARSVHAKMFRILGQAPRIVPSDRKRAAAIADEVASTDLTSISDAALRRLQRRVDTTMHRTFQNHILISVLGTGEYISLLEQQMAKSGTEIEPDATVMLTSALGGVESAQPMEALWRLSRWVRDQPDFAAELARLSWQEIQTTMAAPSDRNWRGLSERFEEFLKDYGFRSQSEWDLGVPRWREDPAMPLNALRNMADASDESGPLAPAQRAAAARVAAEQHYRDLMPPRQKAGYDAALAKAQDFVRIRETTKATCIIGNGAGRLTMLEQGRRWTAKGCLEKADDVFFLLYSEFEEAVAIGKLDGPTAKESVRRRRRQWADVRDYVLPDNFTGLPEIRRIGAAPAPTSVLTGLGVSPGVVTGPARVIASFSDGTAADFQAGDILVAPYTDAPWTPLFATAAGVVVETGGVLSHAATVAREYGIPAVAMIKDATRMIETGQQITVNGGEGQVLLG